MSEEAVLYDREGRTGIITLNRPHRLNAINVHLLRDLLAHLEAARDDEEARVIILTGAGRAFCAGEDLEETAARHLLICTQAQNQTEYVARRLERMKNK